MVISKLDKKDKEVLTVIGTDNFSDGFREMRDSLLEIKQNKDKFLQLLEEVNFENYRKSFLDKLEKSSEEFFNKKLNKNKDDIHSIYDFFGKNYKLTSKKNGFEGSSIEYLEISDFNITKTMQKTSGNSSHSFVGNRKGYSTKVEIETVYFKVNVENIKFNSEFEKNIPEYILENFYKVLLGYLRNHNLYGHLIKKLILMTLFC